MSRIESFIIASVLALGVPLLLLILCGFCFVGLWILGVQTGESDGSIVVVITGLAMSVLAGIVIDIRWLRRWTHGFYQAKMPLMIVLFLVCSLLSIALSMGVPIGNLTLGVLAGLYIGRRNYHEANGPGVFSGASRRVGRFTGAVAGAVALPVGFLALFAGEEPTVRSLVEAVGVPYSTIAGIGCILILCCLLMFLQYWLARGAALLAYRHPERELPEQQRKTPRPM